MPKFSRHLWTLRGVAISLYNKEINYKPIKVFTAFPELNGILRKVTNKSTQFVNSIISGRGVYKLSPLAIKEHPELETIQSKGHTTDVGTGAFKLLDNIIYFIVKPEDNQKNWVQILGLLSNKCSEPFKLDQKPTWRVFSW